MRTGIQLLALAPALTVPLALALGSGCGAPTPARGPSSAGSASAGPASPGVALAAPVPTTMSTRATLKLAPAWHACHDGFVVGNADPRAEVARLAGGCIGVSKMHRVGDPFTGEQTAAGKPQTFKWRAQGGHCYRVYGVGVPAIKNLDILLLDSSGIALGQDGTDNGAPVVLDGGAVCWKQDDEASVVVSVGDGGGAFAVEVWGD